MSQTSLNDEERGGNCLLVPERSYGPEKFVHQQHYNAINDLFRSTGSRAEWADSPYNEDLCLNTNADETANDYR